ncbi:E3 ubiquitin-protein ligase RMA1H1-like [Abrus precatorius]|uniref:E3 ubiquitin-protein ligase RMA n=1 Tax=Abrus precatorius TaxID=3816 RepID=A0A8B8KTF8_ABRPR|nr:E3 ubiquitin-protein ligase RMA1H1-like [Abrus precatorius]XP_027347146.1 E3 ubiquitin-protein ligase RMA1H1-like [Abrus precatorius]
MDLDRKEEIEPQNKNWKSSSDVIADSDRNVCGGFECNICLECVREPVVTLCGHLYCWPCIYKWLHFQRITLENEQEEKRQCPVCKSEVSQSSLVPLYGRGPSTTSSGGKTHKVGMVIPQRPKGPRLHNTTSVYYHPNNPYHHSQQFNSISNGYTSPILSTGGSLNNTFGIFSGMIYARVFGNQMSNIYTYPNSYSLSEANNPRTRRHLMQIDKSLSRISFFLLCSLVLCLLLF